MSLEEVEKCVDSLEEKYNKLVKSLPVWTLEEFYEKEKTMDIAIESSNEEELFDSIEDYCEDLYISNLEDLECACKAAKNIKVYTTKKFHINGEWLKDRIRDYGEDNYSMYYFDKEPECMEYVDEFVKKFNDAQTWYVSDKLIAVVDAEKEVREYFADIELD